MDADASLDPPSASPPASASASGAGSTAPVPARPQGPEALVLGPEEAQQIVEAAMTRYLAGCRERIPDFVDRTFSFKGSLALHRCVLGWDILRAPANVLMAIPNLALRAAGSGLDRWGGSSSRTRCWAAWMRRKTLFLETDLGREVQWRLATELLQLPWEEKTGRRRSSSYDGLAAAIFADPRVDRMMREALEAIGRRSDDPVFRQNLQGAMNAYADARVSAAEIATQMVTLGVGALAVKDLTPGALSLGPALALLASQHMAIASFPLGTWLGGIWYGVFPAAASPLLAFGLTTGLIALIALMTAFTGVLTDPLQRQFGLHRRRLRRLVDVLDQQLKGDDAAHLALKDHYAARLMDMMDMMRLAYRMAL